MFYVPLAQNTDYKDPLMKRLEIQSHFIGGIMLVTDLPPGRLEPTINPCFVGSGSQPDDRQREDDGTGSLADLRSGARRRQPAGLFGAVALLLAAVGLYGVTAYTVAQRTNEIGIRMALGADRAKVVRYVLRGAFARVAVGLALGVPLAIGAGRLISSELYGVSFWDPLALTGAAIALAICSLVAASDSGHASLRPFRPLPRSELSSQAAASLCGQMLRVLFVFLANELDDVGIGQEVLVDVDSPGLGVGFGVVDGDLYVQMPKVGAVEALDDMSLVG